MRVGALNEHSSIPSSPWMMRACWQPRCRSTSPILRRSKHEAEANLLYAACYLFGAKIDTRTESLQHIRAAATTGGGAITMFCHGYASGGGENACARRNI